MHREIFLLKQRWDADRSLLEKKTDSILQFNRSLSHDLGILEGEKAELVRETEVLQQKIRSATQESDHYRHKIGMILWISLTLILILILITFLTLFFAIRNSRRIAMDLVRGASLGNQEDMRQLAEDIRLERRKDIDRMRRKMRKEDGKIYREWVKRAFKKEVGKQFGKLRKKSKK